MGRAGAAVGERGALGAVGCTDRALAHVDADCVEVAGALAGVPPRRSRRAGLAEVAVVEDERRDGAVAERRSLVGPGASTRRPGGARRRAGAAPPAGASGGGSSALCSSRRMRRGTASEVRSGASKVHRWGTWLETGVGLLLDSDDDGPPLGVDIRRHLPTSSRAICCPEVYPPGIATVKLPERLLLVVAEVGVMVTVVSLLHCSRYSVQSGTGWVLHD